MSQRRPRPPSSIRSPRRAQPAAPRSACRWIILIDEAPIRRGALEAHRQLEEKTAALRERLEHFETVELPAFTRWEAQALGPRLTQVREAEMAIRQKQTLLDEIDDEVFFTGCTRLTAFRQIMQEKENPSAARESEKTDEGADNDWSDDFAEEGPTGEGDRLYGDRDLPPGMEAEDFDRMDSRQQRDFRLQYKLLADMYRAVTGREAPSLDEALRASRQRSKAGGPRQQRTPPPPPPRPPMSTEARQTATRVKVLYRSLVRRLHPDHHPRQTLRERELWHTVQAAYLKNDLESLEAIAARLEMGLEGNAASLPVYLLLRLVRDLRAALRSLQAKLGTARKHPAWDFSAQSLNLQRYEQKQRLHLERHLGSLQNHLAYLTQQIEQLTAQAKRKPKARPGRAKKQRQPVQSEFFSFPY